MATAKTNKSTYLNLNTRDFMRGLIVAGLGGFTTALLEVITNGISFSKDTLIYLAVGAIGGISGYLSLNYTTNSKGDLLTSEKVVSKKKLLKSLKNEKVK